MSEHGLALTRESIRDGFVARMVAEGKGALVALTEAQLTESLNAALAENPKPGQDVWLFGYGSLIWNPAIEYMESRIGVVHGYHRRFCLWTNLGRGTPDKPGLTLGLERGGCCRGVAFRIAADAVRTELDIVWRREMVSGAYRPRWIEVRTSVGPVPALTFVINRGHERYAGRVPVERMTEVIATAVGRIGPCAEYLFNTVAHLESLGIQDRALAELRDRVIAHRGAAPPPCGEILS